MVPDTYANYFLASAGASAALIGLLFVAISIAPERTIGRQATAARRAVSGSAFMALLNAFFVSLTALVPKTNIGWPATIVGVLSLVNTLSLGRHVWGEWRAKRRGGRESAHGFILLLSSFAIYGFELWFAAPLISAPRHTSDLEGLAYLLIGAYGLGVGRAWELLGAPHEGILSLFLLQQDERDAPAGADAPRGQDGI